MRVEVKQKSEPTIDIPMKNIETTAFCISLYGFYR